MLPGPNLRKRSNRGFGVDGFPMLELFLSVFTFFLIFSLFLSWIVAPTMPCGVGSFSNPPTINPDDKDLRSVDGKVVHLEGPLYEVRLEDHEFLFSRRGVKLDRVVEMYQWVPKRKVRGKQEYGREWRAELVDSANHPQGHLNPRAMPFNNHTQMSLPVRVGYSGRLSLDKDLNHLLPSPQFAPVEAEDLSKLQRPLQGTFKLSDGYFFRGRDIRMPSVGDVRVSFQVVGGQHVSALLRLNNRVLRGCEGFGGGVERGCLCQAASLSTSSANSEAGCGVECWRGRPPSCSSPPSLLGL